MHYRIRKLGPAAVGIAVSTALTACTPTDDNAGAPMPSNSAPPPLSGNRENPSPQPPPEPAAGSDYADGQYSADGQYGNAGCPRVGGPRRPLPPVGVPKPVPDHAGLQSSPRFT
jgi:hypothetical protein